jgi:hypothetical protein
MKESANWAAATRSNQEAVRRFVWAIAAISVHLEELRYVWRKRS